MPETHKKYNTTGCCGIDCGLCPRFHTKGKSACPGCGGLNFKDKHPSCGFLSCCAGKHGLEVCSECPGYPCGRFDRETEGFDSFVTHRKVFPNLEYIKSNGIDRFAERQKIRINILVDFLALYDDGRSKSFFCASCALLPPDRLQEIKKSMEASGNITGIKEKNIKLRTELEKAAGTLMIGLKLNTKQ